MTEVELLQIRDTVQAGIANHRVQVERDIGKIWSAVSTIKTATNRNTRILWAILSAVASVMVALAIKGFA